MDHLMTINGDGPPSSTDQMSPGQVKRAPSAPGLNDIYVGQIPMDVDTPQLYQFFSQFGDVERIFDGYKTSSGGMKWAFVSYYRTEDANNLLQQAGTLTLAGSILNIRPRDKSPSERGRDRERRSLRLGRSERNMSYQMPPRRNLPQKVSSSTYPPEGPGSGQQWSPYPLLSKTLTVANLPPEFAPKNLYDLFSEFGKAEGAFVYAFPDAQGRRVGEVAMATFLFAQKALEHMDGRYVEGYALEVSYKPAIPIPRQQLVPPQPERYNYSSGSLSPPQPMWNPPPPSVPSSYATPSFPAVSTLEPPKFVWAGYPSAVRDIVPQMQSVPTIIQPPVPTVAPEPSPPPPYSALPPIPEASPESSSNTVSPARDPATEIDTIPPKTPYDPCNLFIKNLDDEVIATQHDLESFFSAYGTIASAFLATYAPKDDSAIPVSKGFGFVAFSRPQEAENAREKVHGIMLGRKKVFVSYAEKKEERHARLKILFANVEKLAMEMQQKGSLAETQTAEAMRDEGISPRGIIRPRLAEETPDVQGFSPNSRQTGGRRAYETQSRPTRGSSHRRPMQQGRKRFQQSQNNQYPSRASFSGNHESFPDLDFHEDFPPLPRSVKPVPSSSLQRTASVTSISKVSQESSQAMPEIMTTAPTTSPSAVADEVSTPILLPQKAGADSEHEIPSHLTSVQGTPAFPSAPPPSSAELSMVNTAASTPTVTYIRPRITLQSLHDRLIHANASLGRLQEGCLFTMSMSTPVSPCLAPSILDLSPEMGRNLREDTENLPPISLPEENRELLAGGVPVVV